MDDLCAGDLGFAMQANITDRRDDGAARVQLIVWAFSGCRFGPGAQHGWGVEYAWIAPNESVELTVSTRNSDGAVTVSGTFANIWTPKLDVHRLVRPFLDLSDFYTLHLGPSWVATSGTATEKPRVAKSPKVDTSRLDAPVVTVAVPTPQVILDPDPGESPESEGIDLTDLVDPPVLVDLGLPTITIPITSTIGTGLDF
jgi:hypothetical protein